MREGDEQVGIPSVIYNDTKANIEALSGVVEGSFAYATDTDEPGWYGGSSWAWGVGSGDELYYEATQFSDYTNAVTGAYEIIGTHTVSSVGDGDEVELLTMGSAYFFGMTPYMYTYIEVSFNNGSSWSNRFTYPLAVLNTGDYMFHSFHQRHSGTISGALKARMSCRCSGGNGYTWDSPTLSLIVKKVG